MFSLKDATYKTQLFFLLLLYYLLGKCPSRLCCTKWWDTVPQNFAPHPSTWPIIYYL